ncbi:hypothetical protein [uncultured Microscilla sp.]|uniref:hypothetical protein n=1 Tax=uncultured Microscilla sp. TaxID=432653 RepID=UPI00262907B8|nr:hypothetical protein [uncultured Microscilla sp.]
MHNLTSWQFFLVLVKGTNNNAEMIESVTLTSIFDLFNQDTIQFIIGSIVIPLALFYKGNKNQDCDKGNKNKDQDQQ